MVCSGRNNGPFCAAFLQAEDDDARLYRRGEDRTQAEQLKAMFWYRVASSSTRGLSGGLGGLHWGGEGRHAGRFPENGAKYAHEEKIV